MRSQGTISAARCTTWSLVSAARCEMRGHLSALGFLIWGHISAWRSATWKDYFELKIYQNSWVKPDPWTPYISKGNKRSRTGKSSQAQVDTSINMEPTGRFGLCWIIEDEDKKCFKEPSLTKELFVAPVSELQSTCISTTLRHELRVVELAVSKGLRVSE
ncbi:hypothetical protein HAX54_019934 [Datura stramonium]|uniref:Uncharacterized protein n=1 Tax=Datura stramonium TaxID=4076 RepID=A0ABS8UR93_DATST|nr:hypothetical protein [Datura stramonium]